MQCLETWHRLAIRVVGMQAKAEIRVGEILRLRYRAHVKSQAVVGLEHAPDERHGRQQRGFRRRHVAQESEAILQQPGEPVESASPACCAVPRRLRPGEVPAGIEPGALQPAPHRKLRSARPVIERVGREPGELEGRRVAARLPTRCARVPPCATAERMRGRSGRSAISTSRCPLCASRSSARLSRSHRLANSLTPPSAHSMVSASGAAVTRLGRGKRVMHGRSWWRQC